MSFESLGLAPALLRALADQGYTEPTPIQAAAIPLVLEGHDLLAAAQTGTGKTAAFALPVLHKLLNGRDTQTRRPRVLVLTPTRELAAQVNDNFRDYSKHMRVATTTIFGGVGMGPQINALRRGVDVIIATPGRLIDHMQQRTIDVTGIDTLVLDEADRMLDMGFMPALKRIVNALPKQKRQTLLFSATFAAPIKALAMQFMTDPREVSATPPNTVAPLVSHHVHPVDAVRKRDLLLHVLSQDSRRQSLVFSRTKHGADKLVTYLNVSGIRAAAIHGNKSQNARTRALSDFKTHRVTVLVATDIAARGIDIDQLPMVINYDLPMVAEDYVHRIGRTGRAGSEGMAVSLVSHDESGLLRDIRMLVKQDIAITPVEGFEPSTPLRLDAGAPRPVQGGGKQRQGRQPARPQGRSSNGGKTSPSHRPHGHVQQGSNEHAAGNRSRRGSRRPAAKA
ncbi:DEAD/DEAH box helicase [Dyella sp.]|jgi:ATP-dependent RNA helicase RhlE|uniref:DEAD/DEAH box helicase n=1 Tax=Dyella sp. TaxID=1869338 RepID=UPI002D779A3A|nr:DEAD/DEAH box helicase [Dyella sp.]HET6433684.1 DEAD/DEAH box helicase [Dyella sp.]